MMAWGKDCGSWDDSVDYANLEAFGREEIPEESFVMTTWHQDEPLNEVFSYSKQLAKHPKVELPNTVILHVAQSAKSQSLVAEYQRA